MSPGGDFVLFFFISLEKTRQVLRDLPGFFLFRKIHQGVEVNKTGAIAAESPDEGGLAAESAKDRIVKKINPLQKN